jgi:nucleoside-diphosphate-sugar epimerase
MHITITGSHGFIGHHLVNHFHANNHHLSCWDTKIGKNICDFTLKGLLEDTTDVVIHLAALAGIRESIDNPDQYWQTNVEYTKKVFDVAEQKDVRVIYASSSACKRWHGNPYAISKYVNEFVAPSNSVGLRFSTVWGDGARGDMLVPQIQNKKLKYATTHQRDLIHVSDVISALQCIIDHPEERGVFDVGTGRTVAVDQLVAHNGLDVPITDGFDYESKENLLPSHRLRALGWAPKRFIMDEKLCN